MWKQVFGYENFYEVNEDGQVRRTAPGVGCKVGQIRKAQALKGRGYLMIGLSANGTTKLRRVATLVCEAFRGPRPEGMQVNHKNGIKNDNRADNLEWVTPSENTRHRFDVLGQTNLRGNAHPHAKATEGLVQIIRTLAKQGCTWRGIAEQVGLSKSAVMLIVTGRNWGWLPFVEVEVPSHFTIFSAHDMRVRAWTKRKNQCT